MIVCYPTFLDRFFLRSARPLVIHEPPQENHDKHGKSNHVAHMFGASRLEHRADSSQTALKHVSRADKAISHAVQEGILFSHFISDINRKSFQSRNLIRKQINAFVVLLLEDAGVGIRRRQLVAAATAAVSAPFNVVSTCTSMIAAASAAALVAVHFFVADFWTFPALVHGPRRCVSGHIHTVREEGKLQVESTAAVD